MKTQAFKKLDDLIKCQCMTEFEYSFIHDMKAKLDKGESFTQKQLTTIERIHRERVE